MTHTVCIEETAAGTETHEKETGSVVKFCVLSLEKLYFVAGSFFKNIGLFKISDENPWQREIFLPVE